MIVEHSLERGGRVEVLTLEVAFKMPEKSVALVLYSLANREQFAKVGKRRNQLSRSLLGDADAADWQENERGLGRQALKRPLQSRRE